MARKVLTVKCPRCGIEGTVDGSPMLMKGLTISHVDYRRLCKRASEPMRGSTSAKSRPVTISEVSERGSPFRL
jgi:hypothetical protein